MRQFRFPRKIWALLLCLFVLFGQLGTVVLASGILIESGAADQALEEDWDFEEEVLTLDASSEADSPLVRVRLLFEAKSPLLMEDLPEKVRVSLTNRTGEESRVYTEVPPLLLTREKSYEGGFSALPELTQGSFGVTILPEDLPEGFALKDIREEKEEEKDPEADPQAGLFTILLEQKAEEPEFSSAEAVSGWEEELIEQELFEEELVEEEPVEEELVEEEPVEEELWEEELLLEEEALPQEDFSEELLLEEEPVMEILEAEEVSLGEEALLSEEEPILEILGEEQAPVVSEPLPYEEITLDLPGGEVLVEADDTVSLPVTVSWFAEDGTTPLTEGLPSEVMIKLLRRAGEGEWTNVSAPSGGWMALTLTAAGSWSGTFRDLPAANTAGQTYTYSAELEPEADKGTDAFTSQASMVGGVCQVRLVKKAAVTSVTLTVEKRWQTSEGASLPEGQHPESAVFSVLRKIDTVDTAAAALTDANGQAVTLTATAASSWRASSAALPLTDGAGHAIDYSIQEQVPDGYAADYSVAWQSDGTVKAYTVTNKRDTMNLSVAILFLEADGTTPAASGVPESVTVSIKGRTGDTPPTYSKVFSSANGWTQTFADIVRDRYTISRPDVPGFTRNTSISSVNGVYQVKYVKSTEVTPTPGGSGTTIPVRAVFYDTDGTTVLTTGLPSSVTVAVKYNDVQYKTVLTGPSFEGSITGVVVSGTATFARSIPSGFAKKNLTRWGEGYSFNYVKQGDAKSVPVRAVFYDTDGTTVLTTGLPSQVTVALVYDDEKEYRTTLSGPDFEGAFTGVTSTGSVKTAKRSIPDGFEKLSVTRWTTGSASGYSFNYKKSFGAEVSPVPQSEEQVTVETTEEPTTEEDVVSPSASVTPTPGPAGTVPVRALFYDTDGTTILTVGLPLSVTVAITYGGVQHRTILTGPTFEGVLTGVTVTDSPTFARTIPSGFVKKSITRWGEGYSFNYMRAGGGQSVPVRAVFYDTDGATVLTDGLPEKVTVALVYDDEQEYRTTLTGPDFEGAITGITSTGAVKTAKRSIPDGFERMTVTRYSSDGVSGYSFNYRKAAGSVTPTPAVTGTPTPTPEETTGEPVTEETTLEPTTEEPTTQGGTVTPHPSEVPENQGLTLKFSRTYSGEEDEEEVPLAAVRETLYFAICREGETKPVQVVKVELENAAEDEVTVNLPSGSYLLFDSDENGNPITPSSYQSTIPADGESFTVDPGQRAEQNVKHAYEDFPEDDNNYIPGLIAVTKRVMDAENSPRRTDETFYVGLFEDAECMSPAADIVDESVLAIELEGGSEQTRYWEIPLTPEDSYTFYLAEVDSEGRLVRELDDFPYVPEFDKTELEISMEEYEQEVELVNVYSGQEPVPSVATPTPVIQEGEGVLITLTRMIQPPQSPDLGYTYEKSEYPLCTKDEDDYIFIYSLDDEEDLTESAGRIRVSEEEEAQVIHIENDYTESIRVSLEPGRYQIYESYEDGEPRSLQAEGIETSMAPEGEPFTVNEEGWAQVDIVHTYKDWPDDDYVRGELSFIKMVETPAGTEMVSDDTFYMGIFTDRDYRFLADQNLVSSPVVTIPMEGRSRAEAKVDVYLRESELELNFYVAELSSGQIQSDGTVALWNEDKAFGYVPRIENNGPAVSVDNTQQETVVHNQSEHNPTATPTSTVTPTPTLAPALPLSPTNTPTATPFVVRPTATQTPVIPTATPVLNPGVPQTQSTSNTGGTTSGGGTTNTSTTSNNSSSNTSSYQEAVTQNVPAAGVGGYSVIPILTADESPVARNVLLLITSALIGLGVLVRRKKRM